jgi:Glycosyltransferase family 87
MSPRLKRAVTLFFVGMLVVHACVFWNVRKLLFEGYPDFTSFYGAGKTIREGHGSRLYDANEQWRVQQEFAPRVSIRKAPLPYLRPPFEALLFVPLTLRPYAQAYFLWNAMSLCAALAVPFLLRRRIPALKEISPWLLVLLPLAFTPVFMALIQGQDSILLLFCYTLAYLTLRRAADFGAGCWLGLGLVKPHLVIPFVAILLLQGRRKVALGFLSVAALLFFVSLAIVGWHELIRYPGYLWWLEHHTGRGLVLPRDTPNLRGLADGFLSSILPSPAIALLVGFFSLAVIFWAASQRTPASGNNSDRAFDLVFSQAIVATFLVSFHAFAYDLSLMLLPIILLVAFLLTNNWKIYGWSRIALIGPIAVLLFGPVYPFLWLRFDLMNLLAIVLLLWMWGISLEISRLRPLTPPIYSGTQAVPTV